MNFLSRVLPALIWLALPFCASAATLLPPGEIQFIDQNGIPLAGGSVFYSIPATTTPKATYQDSAQSILNPSPVVLDAAGRAIVYGSGVYRMQVYSCPPTKPGCTALQGTLAYDQLTADTGATASIQWGGTSGGTANAQTVSVSGFSSTDGQIVAFIAGASNTAALTVTVSGGSPIAVLKDSPTGPVATVGGEVIASNIVELVYVAASGSFHLIDYNANTAFSNLSVVSTLTAGTVNSATISATGISSYTSTIAPTALSGNTNDWNPTGLQTAIVIQASASAAYNLTGLTAPVTNAAGHLVVIENTGTFTITLTSLDTNSMAANRFAIPQAIALQPNQTVALIYDATASRWRATSGGGSTTNYQDFTTSGTWTKPAGLSTGAQTIAQCWGGGGGGGANAGGGGGGGGGFATFTYLTSTLSGTVTVTVGTGGAISSNGVNSSFGTLLTAYAGGLGQNAANGGGGGGGGGAVAGGAGAASNGGAGGGPLGGAGATGAGGGLDGLAGGGGAGGASVGSGGNGFFGGGGGAGSNNSAAEAGGYSVYGGGGGGVNGGTGGASEFGGAGGATGVAGSVPGGGGGRNAAGAAGECRVWTSG